MSMIERWLREGVNKGRRAAGRGDREWGKKNKVHSAFLLFLPSAFSSALAPTLLINHNLP